MCSKPAAPPTPKEPPPPPTEQSANLQAKDAQRSQVDARRRSGFEATLLTGAGGTDNPGNLLKPTLGA